MSKIIKSEKKGKNALFVYVFLISCFGLLKQRAWLWTTKTILILVVHTPVVFSYPTSLVASVLIYSKYIPKEMFHDVT